MASLSASDIAAILKEVYPNGDLPRNVGYKNAPFLAILPKDTEAAYGELIKVPLRYGHPQGASADFSTARTVSQATTYGASKYAAFDVTTINYYGSAQVNGEAVDKSSRDRGSFVRGLVREVDGANYTMKRALGNYIFRNGGAALATASFSSAVATLGKASDVVWFEVGMQVCASATDGTSGSLRDSGDFVTIIAVDRAAGTLTADANWSNISGITNGDYLFRRGDFGAVHKGIEAWVPRSAPSATTFFGVDRSVDSRLGGVRADYSATPIVEGLMDAWELLAREGSSVDFAVMHTTDWVALSKALGSKVVYGTMESYDDPQIGFKTISLAGPTGTCEILADANAPKTRLLMGQLDTWKLYSMGELVRTLSPEGLPYLRTVTADSLELQLVSRANLACDAPGWNGNFAIGS